MPTKISDVPENLLSDFDLVADPEMMRNPQQRMTDALVNDERDIFYTPHNGGHWIVTNYEMGHEILSNPELYGSFPIGVPANYEQRA